MLILPAVVAAAVTAALIPVLDRWARASRHLMDVPNDRSSHRVPTPLVGGPCLAIAVLAAMAIAGGSGPRGGVLAAGAVAIAALSVLDDLRPLSVWLRLAGHVLIAGFVAIDVGPWPAHVRIDGLAGVSMTLAVIWIVGLVNAYNFMDGIDGLAGVQAVVAGAGWAVVGILTDAPEMAAAGLALAASSAVFLGYNWQPARVFMGDTGAAFLGYSFAVLPATAPSASTFGAAALFVWPFVFDAGFTFLRRLARGENVLQAHRTHLYQRLVATGLSHRRVSLAYLALGILGLPAGVCAAAGPAPLAVALGAVVPVAAIALWWAVVRCEAAAARRPAARAA